MLKSVDFHTAPQPNAEMGPLPKLVLQKALLVLKSIDFHTGPRPNAEMGLLPKLVLQRALLVLKASTSIQDRNLMLRWAPSMN